MVVLGLIAKFGVASTFLDRGDADTCTGLSAVVSHYLRSKARHFVTEHRNAPLLFSYASDGTPMKTVERYVKSVGGIPATRREGGALHELLMQKGFLKCISHGVWRKCVVF